MVLADKQKTCNESPKDLSEDISWYFRPRESDILLVKAVWVQVHFHIPLPNCKAYSYRRVEVPTGSWTAGNDSKCNANGIRPSDLEKRTKCRFRPIGEKRSRGSNSRVNVEEDSYRFCCHLAYPTRTGMFEVQFSLAHWLWRNHVSLDMSLDGICNTNFHVIGVQAPGLIARSVAAVLDVGGRHGLPDSNQRLIELGIPVPWTWIRCVITERGTDIEHGGIWGSMITDVGREGYL